MWRDKGPKVVGGYFDSFFLGRHRSYGLEGWDEDFQLVNGSFDGR